MMFHYGLFFIGLELISLYAHAQSPPGNYERLLEDIFVGYDKRVKPFSNEKLLVNISETILGCMLIKIVENSQIATYAVTRKQMWIDPRFHWDPTEYGGIQSVLVPIDDVWRSDIFNYNCREVEELLSDEQDWAKIEYDGHVSIIMPEYRENTCRIMVHRFPFDTQFCTLSSSSNMMDSTQFSFVPIPVNYKPKLFQGNSAWDIKNVTIITRIEPDDGVWGEKGYVFQYVFELERRSTYYIAVVVLPCFFIATVSIVGIFAPGTEHEPGDVANMGLGALLSLMLLLGIVSEKLPKSKEIPLLGFHITVVLFILVVCILLEMASLYYFQKMTNSGKRPPKWLYNVALMGILPGKKKERKNSINFKFSYISSATLINSTSASTISKWIEESANGSDFKINLENGFALQNGLEKKVAKRNVAKKVPSETDLNKWREMMGELKTKMDAKQNEIKEEWDMVEARLDFVGIAIFEAFNIINLLSLAYFAYLPTPDMKDWL